MYFTIYKDVAAYWRWTLYAANHRKIADSAESYINKANYQAGSALVKGSGSAPVYER